MATFCRPIEPTAADMPRSDLPSAVGADERIFDAATGQNTERIWLALVRITGFGTIAGGRLTSLPYPEPRPETHRTQGE